MIVSSAEAANSKSTDVRKVVILVVKVATTFACFFYIFRQIDLANIGRFAKTFEFAWAGAAAFVIALEIPLIALRWRTVVDALATGSARTPLGAMLAINSIATFFGQIFPNVAGDAVRVWLLARLGRPWRLGLVSILIDRGVAILAVVILGFLILLVPSTFWSLSGHRGLLLGVFGSIFVAALLGLLSALQIASILEHWRATRAIAKLARAAHQVLIRSATGVWVFSIGFAVHGMTILAIWLLARAHGMSLTAMDAAVLFVVIVAVSFVPITIGGWGLRELAVTMLMGSSGIALEQALFFSVSFGLTAMIGALPGAIVWMCYSPGRHIELIREE